MRPAIDLPTGNAWAAEPPYDWTPVPAANGIAFQTPAFTTDTTIVGPASLNLELKSTAPVTDLQVTVTEVRPGQAGGIRDFGLFPELQPDVGPGSTALDPIPTYLAADRQNLPAGSSRW